MPRENASTTGNGVLNAWEPSHSKLARYQRGANRTHDQARLVALLSNMVKQNTGGWQGFVRKRADLDGMDLPDDQVKKEADKQSNLTMSRQGKQPYAPLDVVTDIVRVCVSDPDQRRQVQELLEELWWRCNGSDGSSAAVGRHDSLRSRQVCQKAEQDRDRFAEDLKGTQDLVFVICRQYRKADHERQQMAVDLHRARAKQERAQTLCDDLQRKHEAMQERLRQEHNSSRLAQENNHAVQQENLELRAERDRLYKIITRVAASAEKIGNSDLVAMLEALVPSPVSQDLFPGADRSQRAICRYLLCHISLAGRNTAEVAAGAGLIPEYLERTLTAYDRLPRWDTLVRIVRAVGGDETFVHKLYNDVRAKETPVDLSRDFAEVLRTGGLGNINPLIADGNAEPQASNPPPTENLGGTIPTRPGPSLRPSWPGPPKPRDAGHDEGHLDNRPA